MLNPSASSFESKYPVASEEGHRASPEGTVAFGDAGHHGSAVGPVSERDGGHTHTRTHLQPSSHLKFPRERKRTSSTASTEMMREPAAKAPGDGVAGLEGYPWMTAYNPPRSSSSAQIPPSYVTPSSTATHLAPGHPGQHERTPTPPVPPRHAREDLSRKNSSPLPSSSDIWGSAAPRPVRDFPTDAYLGHTTPGPTLYPDQNQPLTANSLYQLQQQDTASSQHRFGTAAIKGSDNLLGLGLGGMHMRTRAGYEFPLASPGWCCGVCGFSNDAKNRRCSSCAAVPGEHSSTPLLSPATPFSPALSHYASQESMLITPHLGAQASSFQHDPPSQALMQTIASNALLSAGAGIYGDLATRPTATYSAPIILEQLTSHVAAIVQLGEDGEDLRSILVGGDPQLALAMGMRGLVGKEAINPWRVLGYEIPSQHFGKFGPKPALGTVAGDWQCACGRENWAKRSVCSRCYPGIEPEFKATVFQHIQPILHFVDRQAIKSHSDQDLDRINEQERRLRRQYNEATSGASANTARRYLPDTAKRLTLPAPVPLAANTPAINLLDSRLRKEHYVLNQSYDQSERHNDSQALPGWSGDRGSSYLQAYLAQQASAQIGTGARLEVLTSPTMKSSHTSAIGDRVSDTRTPVLWAPSPNISRPPSFEPHKNDRWVDAGGSRDGQSNQPQIHHWTTQTTWDSTPASSIWSAPVSRTASKCPSSSTTPVTDDVHGKSTIARPSNRQGGLVPSSSGDTNADDVDEAVLGSLATQLGSMGLDTDST